MSRWRRTLFGATVALLAALSASPSPSRGPIDDVTADADAAIRLAVARADHEGKRVLVDFGANWCGWCRELDRLFTEDPAIARRLAADFVVVSVDVGRFDRNQRLAARYGIRNLDDTGIPILAVLDCQGRVVTVQDPGAFSNGSEGGYVAERVLAFLRSQAIP